MKDLITSAEAPAPAGPYSPGLRAGDLIFLSGQGGFDPETGQLISDDVGEQTAQAFRNIEVLLHAAGATLDDVVSCLVHLTDLAQFAEFNASQEEVEVAFAGWEMLAAEPAVTAGLGWPMNKTAPRWYRLRRQT
jgi:2-iminobutanoate/2-iminopropanoate deaminase